LDMYDYPCMRLHVVFIGESSPLSLIIHKNVGECMHSIANKNARQYWRPAAYPLHISYLACRGAFGIVLVYSERKKTHEGSAAHNSGMICEVCHAM